MAFGGINFLEPAYTSRYGSKPLQDRFSYKKTQAKDSIDIKKTSKKKNTKIALITSGIIAGATAIYCIVKKKNPFKAIWNFISQIPQHIPHR